MTRSTYLRKHAIKPQYVCQSRTKLIIEHVVIKTGHDILSNLTHRRTNKLVIKTEPTWWEKEKANKPLTALKSSLPFFIVN